MTSMNIDWDAATFESGEDERARREREAMEALNARLAERDEQRGLVPTPEAVFPPGMGPRPVPPSPETGESLGAPAAPQPTPGDLGSSPSPPIPSPTDPGPPAISTSPQPPEPTAEASTNPEASTTTAGAAAAEARRRAAAEQTRPPQAPIGGDTGLGGTAEASRAMDVDRFADQRVAARDEDTRRRRIRAILLGLAGVMGLRTIGSGGSMGGALPGLIAAGMVRRPDEEETLLEGDAREREIGAQEAEQASVLQRLQQAREAQSAQDAYRQQQLALRLREVQGDEADRSIRTGLMVNEDRREGDLEDPASDASSRARVEFAQFASTIPSELTENVSPEALGGMSASEIYRLQDSIRANHSARLHGGGGQTGTGAYASTSAEGGLQGAGIAPAWYVAQVAEGNQHDPLNPTANDREVANQSWQQFSPERRADMATARSEAGSTTLAEAGIMERAGYEQAVGGHIPTGLRQKAITANSTRDQILAQVSRGLRAVDAFHRQGLGEQVTGVLADFVGISANDAIAAYNSARGGVISQLNTAREAGVINEGEYQRMIRELPNLSSPSGLIGAARQLQNVAEEMNTLAEAKIASYGYRRTQGARGHGLGYRLGQGGGDRREQQPQRQQGERRTFGPYTVVNDAGDRRQTRTFRTQEAANAGLARIERETGYRRVGGTQ